MCYKYAEDQLRDSLQPVYGPHLEGDNEPAIKKRPTFKYVDGIERLSDMSLPFLVDLPNGSSEAIFIIASKNAGRGMVPMLEWSNGKRSVLDKDGGNGLFLASHDETMKAKIYKTVESVPEILNNQVFWQIFINLEDVLD